MTSFYLLVDKRENHRVLNDETARTNKWAVDDAVQRGATEVRWS